MCRGTVIKHSRHCQVDSYSCREIFKNLCFIVSKASLKRSPHASIASRCNVKDGESMKELYLIYSLNTFSFML